MRRPDSYASLQPTHSTTVSIINPSYPCQPPRSTRHSRARTFRISQIPIAECAAFSAPHPPRVLSLAAFGRRPLLYVAPLSLAGIRNPQQELTSPKTDAVG